MNEEPPADPGTSGSGELNELVQPLDAALDASTLQPGTLVSTPDGGAFRVLGTHSHSVHVAQYDASAEGDDVPIWLYQALDDEGNEYLDRVATALQAVDSPLFPRVVAAWSSGDARHLLDPKDDEAGRRAFQEWERRLRALDTRW